MVSKKKIDGFGDMVAFMVVFLFMMFTIAFTIDIFGRLSKANTKEDIAREYIFRMETNGYLTADDREALIADLERIGVRGISLQGTTIYQVGYGQFVTLSVTGEIKTSGKKGITNSFEWLKGDEYEAFSIHKRSTAKY